MAMKVLVAEDDADFASFLGELLAGAGYGHKVFDEGIAAYHAFREGHFDLAVLDLALPNFSGVEMMRLLKGKGCDIPILVLTGHDTPEVRALAEEVGAAAFLDKSATPEVILAELAQLAERPKDG